MNVLLDSSASSFDFGNEDCDPHSFACHRHYYSHLEELLEPTSFASMQPHQPPSQSAVGKRTRRASATTKDLQEEDQTSASSAPSGKRKARKKSPSMASGSRASSAGSASAEGYTKRDILSGRGGLANKHFGNKVFRRLIKHNKDLYRRLKSKVKQELLIKSILLAVESQGGRFLREDKATGNWYPIDEKEAWSKTCQALREPERSRTSDGEDASEEGTLDGSLGGSVSSSSCQRKKAAASCSQMPLKEKARGLEAAPASDLSPLTRMVRQYTTDDPPRADRQIFDQAMADGTDQLPYNAGDDEEGAAAAAMAPPVLEMGSSLFSLSGFGGFAGMDRTRRSFTYQQNESVNPEPLHGFQGYGASYYQDYYLNNSQPLLIGGQTSIMPPPLMRSDSASHPLGHPQLGVAQGQPHPQHALMMMSSAAASLSPSSALLPSPPGQQQGVPPLPLLRSASSAAFYRSLEEATALDRQESTSSYDFMSFVNGASGNSAPV